MTRLDPSPGRRLAPSSSLMRRRRRLTRQLLRVQAARLREASAGAGASSAIQAASAGPTPSPRLGSPPRAPAHVSVRSATGLAPGRSGLDEGDDDGNFTQDMAQKHGRDRHDNSGDRLRLRRGHDQGRHSALVVGNDGDQRDHPQGRDADADRRTQRPRRPARQEGRAGGRRSGVQLAAVCREGARAFEQGQGRRRVRLLDVGVAQVRAAGVRGAERAPVLSAGIRGRGRFLQRLLRKLRPGQQGHPRRQIPDEQGRRRREALRAGGDRLRLSAHQQQDHPRLPQGPGRRGRGHHGNLHAVRLLGLADRGLQDQGVRIGGQEDRRRLHHQRRRQYPLLQGTRQPGREGDRYSR